VVGRAFCDVADDCCAPPLLGGMVKRTAHRPLAASSYARQIPAFAVRLHSTTMIVCGSLRKADSFHQAGQELG